MKNEKNISSNTGQTSKAVVNLPTEHPFTVPAGYFEQFPIRMLNLVQADPHFQETLPKESPMGIPQGYFEHFSENLLKKIRLEENAHNELETLAPSLIPLRSENPFSVPEGYFNSFETSISIPKRKIVRIFDIKQIVRYAVAASIIGLMFFVFKGTDKLPDSDNQTLASNSKAAELSIEAMSTYLNEPATQVEAPENEELASNDANLLVNIDKETVSMVLAEVSENDIEQFLNQSVNTENNNNTN